MSKRKKRISKIAAADQHGLFQHFQAETSNYATRERYLSQRGGEASLGRDTESLYNLSEEGDASRVPSEYVAPHLSTRYSPDRVGVQAKRVADGVYQDPYTNKVYDYNEGFKTEDGRSFPGGGASLQSSLMRLASKLDVLGLASAADSVDSVLRKVANEAIAETILEEDLKEEGGQDDPCLSMEKADILRALFEAHEDPSSPYKLSIGRWDDLTACNLTSDEKLIAEESEDLVVSAAKTLVNLSKISRTISGLGLKRESKALGEIGDMLKMRLKEASCEQVSASKNDIILIASSMDSQGEYEIADLLDSWVAKTSK